MKKKSKDNKMVHSTELNGKLINLFQNIKASAINLILHVVAGIILLGFAYLIIYAMILASR